MAVMADVVGFQAQIAQIIEVLANSAVVQICRLVDDGYTALRSQMDQERHERDQERHERDQEREGRGLGMDQERQERGLGMDQEREGRGLGMDQEREGRGLGMDQGRQERGLGMDQGRQERGLGMDQERLCGEENDVLRRKLREMEMKMRIYERRLRRRDLLRLRRDQFRPPGALSVGAVDVVVNEAGYVGGPAETDTPLLHILPQEVKAVLPLVKKERVDCDLDFKVELNIRADGSVEAVEPNAETGSSERRHTPDTPHTLPSEATLGFTEPPTVSESLDVLKLERQTEGADPRPADPSDTEPSAELLNNLGLELALMQERVSQLGPPFLQTGSHPDTEHPSCSYSTQADIGSPSRLFPCSAHEMGGFPVPFDMTVNPNPASLPQRKEAMVCNFCGRVFLSVMSLELHQRVHTGQRPYSCLHCGKAFAQPNNLRVHLLIHSGERRYLCSVCGKSFISSSHLKRHRTVHTQEKPYTCALCGQSFSQLCSVRRHRQQSRCGL